MILPLTPSHAHFEKNLVDVEEDYVQDVPYGMIRKTSTTVLRSQYSELTNTSSQMTATSFERSSREGSERGLVPPARVREHRISGPWSRAFAVLERR